MRMMSMVIDRPKRPAQPIAFRRPTPDWRNAASALVHVDGGQLAIVDHVPIVDIDDVAVVLAHAGCNTVNPAPRSGHFHIGFIISRRDELR